MADSPSTASGSDDLGGATGGVKPGSSGFGKLVAPVAAIGATWGVRKVMDSAYRKSTGKHPPRSNDPTTSLSRVIIWAAATAMAIAIVQVVIDRFAAEIDD